MTIEGGGLVTANHADTCGKSPRVLSPNYTEESLRIHFALADDEHPEDGDGANKHDANEIEKSRTNVFSLCIAVRTLSTN